MDEQAVPGPFTSQSDTSRAVLGISAISKINQLVVTTHDCPGYPAEELKDGNTWVSTYTVLVPVPWDRKSRDESKVARFTILS
jgi:hypothetical protein